MRGDIYERIAREMTGRPDATAVAWESLDFKRDGIDAMRVRVADVPLYVRGENVGKPNFNKCQNQQTVYISHEQAEQWVAAHPELCLECGNTGEVFVRWSVDDGTTIRPCPKGCPIPVAAEPSDHDTDALPFPTQAAS